MQRKGKEEAESEGELQPLMGSHPEGSEPNERPAPPEHILDGLKYALALHSIPLKDIPALRLANKALHRTVDESPIQVAGKKITFGEVNRCMNALKTYARQPIPRTIPTVPRDEDYIQDRVNHRCTLDEVDSGCCGLSVGLTLAGLGMGSFLKWGIIPPSIAAGNTLLILGPIPLPLYIAWRIYDRYAIYHNFMRLPATLAEYEAQVAAPARDISTRLIGEPTLLVTQVRDTLFGWNNGTPRHEEPDFLEKSEPTPALRTLLPKMSYGTLNGD